MVLGKSLNPFLLPMLKFQAAGEREYQAEHLRQVFIEGLTMGEIWPFGFILHRRPLLAQGGVTGKRWRMGKSAANSKRYSSPLPGRRTRTWSRRWL